MLRMIVSISSHTRNELKSHSQTVADMNLQMHKTTKGQTIIFYWGVTFFIKNCSQAVVG